jgi:hypothetical protein
MMIHGLTNFKFKDGSFIVVLKEVISCFHLLDNMLEEVF